MTCAFSAEKHSNTNPTGAIRTVVVRQPNVASSLESAITLAMHQSQTTLHHLQHAIGRLPGPKRARGFGPHKVMSCPLHHADQHAECALHCTPACLLISLYRLIFPRGVLPITIHDRMHGHSRFRACAAVWCRRPRRATIASVNDALCIGGWRGMCQHRYKVHESRRLDTTNLCRIDKTSACRSCIRGTSGSICLRSRRFEKPWHYQ